MYTENEMNIYYLCIKRNKKQQRSCLSVTWLFAQRPSVSHCSAECCARLCQRFLLNKTKGNYFDFNECQIGVIQSSSLNGGAVPLAKKAHWTDFIVVVFLFFSERQEDILDFSMFVQPCAVD